MVLVVDGIVIASVPGCEGLQQSGLEIIQSPYVSAVALELMVLCTVEARKFEYDGPPTPKPQKNWKPP